jgi:predicted nuclease of predicted toxin-antitoxin system
MRLLLDECLPVELAAHLPGHTVRTVRDMGWLGIYNGRLLKLIAESAAVDVFLTVDKNLPHQQNLRGLPFAVAVLRVRSTRVSDVLAQAPALLRCLPDARPGEAMVVALPAKLPEQP